MNTLPKPNEMEMEKASNSYLMSLVAIVAGMPLPIINLFATFIFFLGNRKSTYFVRWHCTQALLSQASLLFANSFGFGWTMSILFGDEHVNNPYIAYVITVFIFNITELIATMITATKIRKGQHSTWWFYGDLTHLLCKP
jgi:uncharacterized Tic20 family protein